MTDITIVSVPPPDITVVSTSPSLVTVVSAGVGLQGAPGTTAASTDSVVFSYQAAQALGGHRVVFLNTAGKVDYASNNSLGCMHKVVGLTQQAANINDLLVIKNKGTLVEPSWSFNPDLPVFLGTNGLLTQAPPSSPALFSMIIGFPVSATELFIDIKSPILLT